MKVIETSREETRAAVITIGRLRMKSPVEPGSMARGRYAMMLVAVAYRMARASRVGPSQAAIKGGWPAANSRLMASLATTGSSTSKPRAMISEAMETCWRSTPAMYDMPNVMVRVMGMERAISSAERHSQKPSSATSTTSAMAS